MKLIEVGRDDVSGGVRVTAEIEDGSRVTWVQDADEWRNEETGGLPGWETVLEVERLLWLHDREELRKRKESGGVGVTLTDLGRLVAGALGAGGAGGGGSCTVHTGGTLTQAEFLAAQQGVRSGEATVASPERTEVHLHKAVVAYVVEAPETLEVLQADGTLVRVSPGQSFAVVEREISTQGLQALAATVGAMLERRMRGER